MAEQRAILAAACAALLLGCGPAPAPDSPAGDAASPPPPAPAGPVALTTDRDSYRPGDVMTLTLTNRDSAQYYFNPCPRTLEREVGNAWEPVDEGQRMCTMEAWILDPNGTRTAPAELPGSLQPGRHRVTISLSREGQTPPAQAVQAVSPPFAVVR